MHSFSLPTNVYSCYWKLNRDWAQLTCFLIRDLWGKEEPKADQILVQKKTQDLLHQPFIHPNPTTVLRQSMLPPALQSRPWHFLNSYIWYLYCIWKYSYLDAYRILFLFYPLYLPPDCKYLEDRWLCLSSLETPSVTSISPCHRGAQSILM